MATETRIYALLDPASGAIRYVGKTCRPLTFRHRQHLEGKCGRNLRAWIFDMIAQDTPPPIIEIEVVAGCWKERERFWIAHYKAQGCDLLNVALGGDGPNGYRHTPEARAKISSAHLGRQMSETSKQKMRGRIVSPETRAKISAAKRAQRRVISEKQKEQIRAALTGRRPTDETRAKLRKRVCSQATRQRLSEAARAQWASGRGWAQ